MNSRSAQTHNAAPGWYTILMILMALVSWWYGAGWQKLGHNVQARVSGALTFFSVGLLLKTLFDPFRQIDAGGVKGPINVMFRAWFDKTFSRFVGFFVRTSVVIFGLVAAAAIGFVGIVQLLVWPVLPVLPILGICMVILGWAP